MMKTKGRDAASHHAYARPGIVPLRFLLLFSVVALAIGIAASSWVGIGVSVIAVCASVAVLWWARARGDILVAVVALLLFWMPFITTVSRFNISPQEIGVYLICLACAMLDPQGVKRWVADVLVSASAPMRLAILIFILAAIQSLAHIPHLHILDITYTLRAVVVYPISFGFLVAYTIQTRAAERVLILAFSAGAFAFACYAFSLKLWGVNVGNGAVTGRLGAEASFLSQYHPNNLALYLVLALAFLPGIIHDAVNARSLRTIKFTAVFGSSVIALVALWLTYSRGALGALVLGIVVVLGVLAVWGRRYQRLISVSVLLAGVCALGGILLWKGPSALGRYGSLLNPSGLASDPDVTFRTELYNRALHVISEHPFTGIGLGQFATTGNVPFSPHDTYLDIWVGTGLFGVLALVAVLLVAISTACVRLRHHSQIGNTRGLLYTAGFIVALVAFSAQAFVEAYDAQPRIAPAIWVLALAAQASLFMRTDAHAKGASDDISSDTAHLHPERARSPRSPSTALPPGLEWQWGLETGPLPIVEQETLVISARMAAVSARPADLNSDRLPSILPAAAATTTAGGTPPDHKDALIREDQSGSTGPHRTADEADALLMRAPSSYLWNQIYALWMFGSGFILSVIITRGLKSQEYGVYAILTSIVSTLTFLFAMGLEDVATVFVPRVIVRDGLGAAGRLIRRVLTQRILVVGTIGVLLAVGLIYVVPPLEHVGAMPPNFEKSVQGLRPLLMGAYLIGSSVVALETALFASVLRSRTTLLVGGFSQLASMLLTALLLYLGHGVDGIFFAQAAVAWITALIYVIVLGPYARAKTNRPMSDAREMRRLMVGAWLTNVTNGALGKQMDIVLMSIFAVGYAAIGYYNLAYQLVSIASALLISGLGGVGMATMSAAFSGGGAKRLASIWRATLMLQLLMAIPIQVLTFALADQIVSVLYGSQYSGATPLMRIFLVASIFGRLVGGGSNQSGLYVVGRQGAVLAARWGGLIINVILDVVLIQFWGPAGALLATGFSQLWVGLIEYFMLRREVPVRYPIDFAQRVIGISCLGAIIVTWWAPVGFIGLIGRSTAFVITFFAGIMMIRLGNPQELTDMIALNPKLEKLLQKVRRSSGRLAIRSSGGELRI